MISGEPFRALLSAECSFQYLLNLLMATYRGFTTEKLRTGWGLLTHMFPLDPVMGPNMKSTSKERPTAKCQKIPDHLNSRSPGSIKQRGTWPSLVTRLASPHLSKPSGIIVFRSYLGRATPVLEHTYQRELSSGIVAFVAGSYICVQA